MTSVFVLKLWFFFSHCSHKFTDILLNILGKALCLMGPVGSGKTSLVEHLAVITGRKGIAFKKIQLGDQTDSRMLLGSHQCTDVPGEFVWRPGVLTEVW